MAGDNRTEQPTSRRRSEARGKGQVARSAEITSVGVLFAGLLMLNSRAPELLRQYMAVTREAFLQIGARDQRPEAMLSLAMTLLASSAMVIAPLVLAVTVSSVGLSLVQVGPMFSTEVIKPDLGKLNPVQGIKRLWSPRILMELAKASVKVAIMGFVAYQVIAEKYWMVVGLQAASPEGSLVILGNIILEIGQKCGIALLVMAVADYVYQRRSHESSLKMTKQEVKEESRQSEGDPQIKSRIRSLQRQMASKRMMQSVPHADVVVTNPTHFAVALEYKPDKMQAPLVTAKGQNLIAEQIKRVAREHGVPVVENPPLARALHRSTEIGDSIPQDLYQAVAEVLAFIYRLKHPERGMN